MILVGFYGNKKNIITADMNKGLADILIQIALPFMIVTSFIFTYDQTIQTNVIKTFYYSFAAYLIIIGVSYGLVFLMEQDKRTIVHFANVFPNTGYVGFPILLSLYGPEGVIYGSIFNMFFVIFLWTYGIMLFKQHDAKENLRAEIKKVLFNPSIIAVLIGIAIMLFNIELPNALLSATNSIGSMTGPLSMIIIGGILARAKITHYLRDWTIYYGLATKLVIVPLSVYFILAYLVGASTPINVVILMSAMPASAMTSILAESFHIESDYAAVLVALSTLLSLLTVPLLLRIITF